MATTPPPVLLPDTLPFGVSVPAPDTLRVLVDGVETPILVNSLDISNAVGQRSTGSVTLYDADGAYHYDEGQEVDIIDAAGVLVYSGVIETDDEDKLGPSASVAYPNALIHKLTLKDWHYLADKRLVATSYPAGMTCGAIIADLIATVLADEGVTAGDIAAGPLLPDVVFNYCTAAAALDALTQKAGAYWWEINQYKQLNFQPYTAVAAPWSLTADGNGKVADARYGTVHVKRGKPLYRNRQYVRATGLTDLQTEERKGDSTTKAFTMGYPLAKQPTILVNAVAKTVGIKGVDTGKDWYWNEDDATITQDDGATALSSSDTLHVEYYGKYQLITISEDSAEIAAQQAKEGGATSGKVEAIADDASLITTDAAFQESAALLAKYAQQATTLTFQTMRSGLAPGQLLHVDIPAHNLRGVNMLIESVHLTDEDGAVIWYEATALLGPVNTSWVQFFGTLVSNAHANSDTLSVGSQGTLVIPVAFDATESDTASFTVTVQACPIFPCTFPLTLC